MQLGNLPMKIMIEIFNSMNIPKFAMTVMYENATMWKYLNLPSLFYWTLFPLNSGHKNNEKKFKVHYLIGTVIKLQICTAETWEKFARNE